MPVRLSIISYPKFPNSTEKSRFNLEKNMQAFDCSEIMKVLDDLSYVTQIKRTFKKMYETF